MNDILESNKKEINMDLTSLIDIIFLLLIFFMVTTTFDKMSGAKLSLPQSHLNEVTRQNEKVVLYIDSNKEITIEYSNDKQGLKNKIKTSEKELTNDLLNLKNNSKTDNLSIRADKGIDYGEIVLSIEKAKDAGFKNVNLETIKK